jgi:hypothetical protein
MKISEQPCTPIETITFAAGALAFLFAFVVLPSATIAQQTTNETAYDATSDNGASITE